MRFSKKFAAVAIVSASALAAGAAFAYWTTSGGGSGSASTGTHTAVAVTQLGTISGLVPGGVAQPVDFRINNSLTTNQYVTSVAVSFDTVDTDGAGPDSATVWNTGCSAADFTIVQPTAINSDLTPGNHDYQPSGASLKLDNLVGTNQDGCKNQSIVLAFSIVVAP